MNVAKKHFSFEDDSANDLHQTRSIKPIKEESYVNDLNKEKKNMTVFKDDFAPQDTRPYGVVHDDDDMNEEQPMKTKKKFKLKIWHCVIAAMALLVVIFLVYCMIMTNESGPVYGDRCKGMLTIDKKYRTQTISTIKSKYSQVKSMDMEIACKELKIDITFESGMSTAKAKSIGEEAAKTLDGLVGRSKVSGSSYSDLFGTYKNVNQYEVDLYMTSSNSDDFPIYGTKHVGTDSYNYTLASVKDAASKKQAEATNK